MTPTNVEIRRTRRIRSTELIVKSRVMGRKPPCPPARDASYFRVSNPTGRTSNPLAMFITRKAEFSASHVCRLPLVSDNENRRLFGTASNPNGHGHNYVVEVTVEGEPDPETGMIMDLKDLK